jgi:hypothetical protein
VVFEPSIIQNHRRTKQYESGIGNSRKRAVCVPQKEQAGQGQRLRLDRVRESFTGVLRNQHVAQAENCNRTELLSIFIWKFAVTSIPLYLSDGLDVCLTKTPHLFPGLPGHPTSLHVTFSSGAMLKIKFTCPFYPKIYQRIMAAVDTIDVDMLQRVWQELDYRFDVCRVTRGRHMEHL